MTLHDSHGLPLSTSNARSAQAYDRAVQLFARFQRDPLAVIGKALDEDPGFVAGHLLRAGLLLGSFDPLLVGMAGTCLAAAAAEPGTPNERERSLLGALDAWVGQGMAVGNRRLDRHVVDHPRDLFAIQLAHLGDLMLGRTAMLRDRIARVIGRWSDGDPGHPFLLAMQAFGLEENGAYAQAEALALRALERDADNSWAVHAVAHVHETSGRPHAGAQWLEHTRPRWCSDNILSVHHHWHLALFRLEHDGPQAALALYDEAIAPTPESLAMNLSDATALLWRLTLQGTDAGTRWDNLAQRWLQRAAWGRTAFTDLHAALCLAVAGRDADNEAFGAALQDVPGVDGGAVPWQLVVRPARQAFADYVAGDYRACADRLLALLPRADAVGGSHAQRELLTLTARRAAEHAGDAALADALHGQRQEARRIAASSLWRLPGAGATIATPASAAVAA
ncbi:MAG: tetratricopeptide repeat protein [Piscinibacter sp.]|uniref:tetratricopeptide repeat protein n=1 Tax=Piscinibacter TaxID=1114981 RepID=UPI000FDF1861|nr:MULTISPECIES: tetratricopeptide repeat protein [Piscinibacter]MCW5663233.1 tetratricopeptide repeat protein [Piscinibacter sp.]